MILKSLSVVLVITALCMFFVMGCQDRSAPAMIQAKPVCPAYMVVQCGVNPSVESNSLICSAASSIEADILTVNGTWNVFSPGCDANNRGYAVDFLTAGLYDQQAVCAEVLNQLKRSCPKSRIE